MRLSFNAFVWRAALVVTAASPCFGQSSVRGAGGDLASAALVAPPRASWPTNGGNVYNQRYSPLTQIDRGNVATLKGVWRTHLRGSGLGQQYSGEAQPIVYDGVAYVITGADDVFALSLDNGEIQSVISSQSGSVQNCFVRAAANTDLAGLFSVKMVVEGTGRVSRSRVQAPHYMFGQGLLACVQHELAGWHFPATGAPTLVTLPVNFK